MTDIRLLFSKFKTYTAESRLGCFITSPNPIALLTSNLIGHESNISLISLHLFDTSRDTSCLRRYWWFEDVDEEHFVVCEKEVLGEELAHKAARSGDCNLHGWRELLIEMWILVVQWTVMLEARLM
ncbi:hypothetical protein KCU99_g324, partial [Aureobasidium melanogenum]